jgi:anti-sigma B factor antagonist
MNASVVYREGTAVLRLAGRIDTASAPEFEQHINSIISEGHNRLLLNFSEVSYICSATLRVLIATMRELKKANGSVCLCGLTTDVYHVFKLTKLTSVFSIFPGEDDGLG